MWLKISGIEPHGQLLLLGRCGHSGPLTYAAGFEWKADFTVTMKAGAIQASMPDT